MTNRIFFGTFLGALGVGLLAAASAASAQEVIIRDPALAPPPAAVITQPIAAAPVETVETVRTVSTDVGPRRVSHRRVTRGRTARVTTREYARDRPGSGRRRRTGRGRAAGLHPSRGAAV